MASALSDYISPVAVVSLMALPLMYFALTRRRRPEFPGPKGYPIIGNVLDFPSNPEWKGLSQLGKKYGVSLLEPRWLHAEPSGDQEPMCSTWMSSAWTYSSSTRWRLRSISLKESLLCTLTGYG